MCLTENGEDLVGRDVVAQLLLTPNAQPVNLVEVAKAQKVLEERRRHLPLQTRRSRAVVRMLRQVLDDGQVVCVQELEHCSECSRLRLFYKNLFGDGLLHSAVQLPLEDLRSGAKNLRMSRNPLSLHQEGDVGPSTLLKHGHQVVGQRLGRHFDSRLAQRHGIELHVGTHFELKLHCQGAIHDPWRLQEFLVAHAEDSHRMRRAFCRIREVNIRAEGSSRGVRSGVALVSLLAPLDPLALRVLDERLVSEGDAVTIVVHDAEGSSLGLAQVAHLPRFRVVDQGEILPGHDEGATLGKVGLILLQGVDKPGDAFNPPLVVTLDHDLATVDQLPIAPGVEARWGDL
mmetsp:Transcript_19945/g.46763  ORF Transcript_19945/g.46763 Transcript_19945/m.46763 type:complete len:344 (+) Transcript_19945:419-1450(+)